MSPTLLLDLDGTLVDSVPDLASALNRVLVQRGIAGFSYSETAAMVGDGLRRLIERAFAARGRAADAAAVAAFAEDYGKNYARATRLYPGAEEALEELRAGGWRMAVCTNKPEQPARALLAALGIANYFAAVGAGDSFPVRKPDPGHLLETLRAAGGTPRLAVAAGDHRNDVAGARAAGVPCVFAKWGYGRPEMAAHADATASCWAELPRIARSLLRH